MLAIVDGVDILACTVEVVHGSQERISHPCGRVVSRAGTSASKDDTNNVIESSMIPLVSKA